MSNEKKAVTTAIVQAVEKHWRDYGDGQTCTRKDIAKEDELTADEAITIGLAAVTYHIRKTDEPTVQADDTERTDFVRDVHEMAKSFKAEYGSGLFDAVAIAAALKLRR